MGRQKRTLQFRIDETKVFDYMITHGIKYLKDFYAEAGITMTQYYHCQNRGILSLEHAWKLADYMGCMIEDVIIAEETEEEK